MSKKKTLLIVDDSWVTRRFLTKLICNHFETDIVEAIDGIDALAKIEKKVPDCLLLDLLMPNKNGEEVLLDLKSKSIELPIIIISADIQDTTMQNCLDLGVYCFINKPPDKTELINVLRDILE